MTRRERGHGAAPARPREAAGEAQKGTDSVHDMFQVSADLTSGAGSEELQRKGCMVSYSGAVQRSSAGKPTGCRTREQMG